MESLFDKDVYNEVVQRLNNLTSKSQRKWGKMDVAQMMAHSTEAFKGLSFTLWGLGKKSFPIPLGKN